MKAVWYTRQGPPAEVMQFGEQPTPHAAAGEVRVRLHASAVNPADCNRCVGRSYAMEGPLIIPNSDGSGVVDEVGAGVDHVADVDFGGNLAVTLQVVAPNGSIAYYASRGNLAPIVPAQELMRCNLSIHGILLNSVPHSARKRAQSDIVRCLRNGGLLHTVSGVYPLARTPRGSRRSRVCAKAGHRRG